MKKLQLLMAVIVLTATNLVAQRTSTYFQKTYKTNKDTTSLSFQSVGLASDGGYALLGYYQDKTNQGDMVVIRTDSLGAVKWTMGFTSDTIETGTGIRPTSDGGFVVSGWNASPTDYTKGDMLLAKLDAAGTIKWINQFGGQDVDEAGDVAVMNNGNICVAGRSPESVGGAFSAFYILTKADGLPEKGQYVRFGTAPSAFSSIDKTYDGGTIASGYTGTFLQPTRSDPMMVKFNSLGVIQWGKRYTAAGTQFNSIVRQTRDSGYITVGQQAVTQPDGSVPQTFYVIKTKANGDTLFCKAYDTGNFEYARTVTDVGDGYIVSGYTTTGKDTVRYRPAGATVDTFFIQDRQTPFAMKIDVKGAILWGKLYGDTARVGRIYGSTPAYDGGATLVGETYGYGNTYGAGFVAHIDKNGLIGTGATCPIRNITLTVSNFTVKDSTNVVVIDAGELNNNTLRRSAVTIIKTDICTGTGLFTDVADNRLPDNAIKVYPNPAHGQMTVEINVESNTGINPSNIQVFDAVGRMIHTNRTSGETMTVDVSAYPHGIYFLKVEQGGKYAVKKFVVD
jgi:hypothetical protein